MAGHNWELVRDLGLAQARKDEAAITRLTLEIQTGQSVCSHAPNPDKGAKPDLPLLNAGLTTLGERCYKCGMGLECTPVVKPGIVKTRRPPLEIKRAGNG